MIQSTNSHVRRLLSEKGTYEEELQKAKELLKGRMQGLLIQCKSREIILVYTGTAVLLNSVMVLIYLHFYRSFSVSETFYTGFKDYL